MVSLTNGETDVNIEIRRGGKALPHWREHRYCTSKKDLHWQILGGLQFGVYKVEGKTKKNVSLGRIFSAFS